MHKLAVHVQSDQNTARARDDDEEEEASMQVKSFLRALQADGSPTLCTQAHTYAT